MYDQDERNRIIEECKRVANTDASWMKSIRAASIKLATDKNMDKYTRLALINLGIPEGRFIGDALYIKTLTTYQDLFGRMCKRVFLVIDSNKQIVPQWKSQYVELRPTDTAIIAIKSTDPYTESTTDVEYISKLDELLMGYEETFIKDPGGRRGSGHAERVNYHIKGERDDADFISLKVKDMLKENYEIFKTLNF